MNERLERAWGAVRDLRARSPKAFDLTVAVIAGFVLAAVVFG